MASCLIIRAYIYRLMYVSQNFDLLNSIMRSEPEEAGVLLSNGKKRPLRGPLAPRLKKQRANEARLTALASRIMQVVCR